MRLSHQLFAGSALVFLVVLAAVFGTHVETSRAYLEKQLASHAQDAATSLAVALTASLRDQDMALAETTISAVFAHGYYRRIALLDQNGTPLFEKRQSAVDGAPLPKNWIRTLFSFETPPRTALVTAGWRQLGQIEVESSPEFAHRQLEDFSASAALWMAAAYLLTLLLLRVLMHRVLDPLRRIELAVAEIAQRRFKQISPLPKTRELRRVVEGFNRLSTTVEHLLDEEERRAERFRLLAYTDQVVGLPNRTSLLARLDALAGEMSTDTALAVIEIDGLRAYNSKHGYPGGDELIVSLSRIVREVAENTREGESFCARLQGACFAVLLSDCDELAARVFGDTLRARLYESIHDTGSPEGLDFAIGICSCTLSASGSELLAVADTALAAARHLRLGAVVIDWQSTLPDVASQAWQQRIRRALKDQRFLLVGQGVYSLASAETSLEHALTHREVFARMRLEDGSELVAGQFIPMAARHGQLEDIDRACLAMLFALLNADVGANPNTNPMGRYSFNLSSEALRRTEFTRWLLGRLEKLGPRASSLIFEVTDFAAQAATIELLAFATEARRLGVALAIDQFGLSAGGFQVLRRVLPDYVKLAGSLLQDVSEGSDKHFYLESLCHIASSLSIPVIATCVEQAEQIPMLRRLGVHSAQGNALTPVQSLLV